MSATSRKAIALAALDPGRFGGKTYEIGGPQVMSMVELHRAILEITGQDPEIVHMPDFVAGPHRQARLAAGRADHQRPVADAPARQRRLGQLPGLEAFGIEPTPLAAVGIEWLGRFNRGGRFTGSRIHLTATS